MYVYNGAKFFLCVGGMTLHPSKLVYTVSFFGHRVVPNFSAVESKVEQLISDLVSQHPLRAPNKSQTSYG